MSTEINKKLTRRYNQEVWSEGSVQAANELVSPEVVFASPTGTMEGLEAFKKYLGGIHALFPDIRFDTEQVIADGDQVVLHWTMTGTHSSDFMGIPASNNRFSVSGVSLLSFDEAKIAKAVLFWDRLDLAQQLGASLATAQNS